MQLFCIQKLLFYLLVLFQENSLGDIDSDGLDELVFIDSNNASLVVKNSNDTYVNGFPVEGNFFGTPIIADIIDIENDSPEIICREDDNIIILSSNGERLLELTSLNVNQDLRIISIFWKRKKNTQIHYDLHEAKNVMN